MATRAAVDIGGTFTDLVYLDEETRDVGLAKSSTTAGRFEEGVMNAVGEAQLGEVDFLAHGTTVIINALTERKGAVTALLTTKGFRDVLEIQRANRPDLYNLTYAKPRPFVPRRLRLEVTERMSYKGEVLAPLDEEGVRAAIAEARRQGADAFAICFLHSYANDAHERRAAEIVRAEWPEVAVTASHELTNEWREFDRTSTAVLDAYVKPVAAQYLERLAGMLGEAGIPERTRYAMQSNGGISRFELAGRTPINLIESGPVGGVIGAAAIGQLLGERNLITLDIGGTTAKASLVESGNIRLTSDYHIERSPVFAGYPVKVPVVDIVEIGAGGGSIAWLDAAGALKVGPQSAGADPGPASYGWGGTEPTVTDANVVAGRINPDYFLGGRITLDVERAREALRPIAEALDVSVEEAALGVIRIANANMIHLLKLVSVRRGRDPRDFAIVAFGGGGSMHATALARELQVPRVIVPPAPGHFSAWGMLASDLRHDLVQTRFARADDADLGELTRVWRELEERMRATFAEEGVDAGRLAFVRTADMRYAGQEHTVNVPIPDGVLGEDERAEIERRFHDLHEQLYTFRQGSPIEFVNFRLTGLGAVPKPELRRVASNGGAENALKGARDVDFDELGRHESRIYERERLGAGAELDGPAVIEEPAASTVVFPGQRLRVDEFGSLVVEKES
ncbi:MAG TPA: hydantoinase/oxoprolinase family protein [Gaiellaceae bacterium]